MLSLVLAWIINALSLIALAWILPAVHVQSFGSAMAAALVLSVVNLLIRPVLIVLTLPVNLLTLGLFTLIINGFLFWLVANFIQGFTVGGFWWAVLAALLYSLISSLINAVLNPARFF